MATFFRNCLIHPVSERKKKMENLLELILNHAQKSLQSKYAKWKYREEGAHNSSGLVTHLNLDSAISVTEHICNCTEQSLQQ